VRAIASGWSIFTRVIKRAQTVSTGLYGAGKAAESAGNFTETKRGYHEKLVESRRQLIEAKAFLSTNKW
jgi:hypothetical protein